jgi:hypothetical protein
VPVPAFGPARIMCKAPEAEGSFKALPASRGFFLRIGDPAGA